MYNGKAPKPKLLLGEDQKTEYFYVDKLSSKWYQVVYSKK